jgi:phasin family protein
MLTKEQAAATQKTSLELLFNLTNKCVDGVERLIQLNTQTIRSTLTDTLDQAQKVLSAKEPREWLAWQNNLAAPMAEKAQAYHRQLFDIVTATQAEFARCLQAQWAAYGNGAKTLMEDVAKNAPVGSEAAVAALDSAISAANALVESLQKTGEQTVEMARSSFNVVAAAASKSARRASEAQAAKRYNP